jgi:hypothetical protein
MMIHLCITLMLLIIIMVVMMINMMMMMEMYCYGELTNHILYFCITFKSMEPHRKWYVNDITITIIIIIVCGSYILY